MIEDIYYGTSTRKESERIVLEHDENGILTRKESFDNKGNSRWYELYFYNEAGSRIESQHYSDNKHQGTTTYTYTEINISKELSDYLIATYNCIDAYNPQYHVVE